MLNFSLKTQKQPKKRAKEPYNSALKDSNFGKFDLGMNQSMVDGRDGP